ncbi:hypothetical protein WAI453_011817 [Rhynchosporium graminicola]|uniref:N-acetyltransferase domain-containing protein n=1 Tax=Rhynchosporium graminicola TaxID=2792576 RepID=A0A1E1K0G9_9HELO|nr:uncharacterized protein RCO7_06988 [Rhynchosporium commune]
MIPINITTTRGFLIRNVRPHEHEAYGSINELVGSPESWRNDFVNWANTGATQLFIIRRGANGQNSGLLAVAEGTVMGFIRIVNTVRHDVSFRVHPQFRGQGVMKEVLNSTFSHVLTNVANYRLWVETRSDNYPVIHIMNNVFRLRGQLNHFGGGGVFWQFGWVEWTAPR